MRHILFSATLSSLMLSLASHTAQAHSIAATANSKADTTAVSVSNATSHTATQQLDGSGEFDAAYLAQIDSIMAEYEKEKKMKEVAVVVESFNKKALEREMSFSTEGIFPLLRGLIFTSTEHSFISHPAAFEKKDDVHKWNDYAVGSIPLAATWVMKTAGVKSRSKMERMLTANALALGISFGTSQLLKHTVSETRPDMTDDHSFPSGHTTLAFASATILCREYGYISPWITVGAYTTATATQVLRMQHNRHWINDLYTGAGIGMVGTNLAYFLTDKIFGEKAINAPEVRLKDMKRVTRFLNNPSGLSLTAGTEVGNRKIDMDGQAAIKLGAALSTGIDATWSMTPTMSAELIARFVEAQTKVYGTNCNYTGDNLRMAHIDLGCRWSMPMTMEKRIGLRAFAGVRTSGEVSMRKHACAKASSASSPCAESYGLPSEVKAECGAGMTYECLSMGNSVWGFNFDYYHTFSHIAPNRYSFGTVWKVVF